MQYVPRESSRDVGSCPIASVEERLRPVQSRLRAAVLSKPRRLAVVSLKINGVRFCSPSLGVPVKRAIVVSFVGIMTLTLVVSIQREAKACSCITQDPVEEARRHDVIFGGYLKGEASGMAIFSADAVYKGGLRPGTDVVVSGMNGVCTVGHYTEGAYYVVFAQWPRDLEDLPWGWHQLYVPGCNPLFKGRGYMSHKLYGLPAPERVPIPRIVPSPGSPIAVEGSLPWLAVGLGLGAGSLIGGGAVLLFRKQRSTGSP